MLPKNVLVNLLYRYKLAKQAALNEYVKEAYLKQLQYQDQIEQLIDLYRTSSLVKKASLLNDLYEQTLLTKLAQGEGEVGFFGRIGQGLGALGRKMLAGLREAKDRTVADLQTLRDKAVAGLREAKSRTLTDLQTLKDTAGKTLGAIGNKIKSNKQGLIGGGIGLLTGLGAGLLSGRSSAYERGKADALKNLNEEELKALLALMGGKK